MKKSKKSATISDWNLVKNKIALLFIRKSKKKVANMLLL